MYGFFSVKIADLNSELNKSQKRIIEMQESVSSKDKMIEKEVRDLPD